MIFDAIAFAFFKNEHSVIVEDAIPATQRPSSFFLLVGMAGFPFFFAPLLGLEALEVVAADPDDAGTDQPDDPLPIRLARCAEIDLGNPLGHVVTLDEVNLHCFRDTFGRDGDVIALVTVVQMKLYFVESPPIGRCALLLPTLVFGNDRHPFPHDTRRIPDVATDGIAMIGFMFGINEVGTRKQQKKKERRRPATPRKETTCIITLTIHFRLFCFVSV
jgi:hypothetical protein